MERVMYVTLAIQLGMEQLLSQLTAVHQTTLTYGATELQAKTYPLFQQAPTT